MPYVSDGSSWGIEDSLIHHETKIGMLYQPIGGVLPDGILALGAYSATAQAFANPATHYWNSEVFNTQGQRWEGDTGNPASGCSNAATPRTSGGNRYNHVTEFEILCTGQALDLTFYGTSSYEVMVYVEHNSKMYRAEATPKAGTTSGLCHLPLNFAASYHGRIRVVLAGGWLVGIKCEQSTIIKRSPDRILAICDGAASQYILFIEISVTGLTRWFSGGGTANINSRLGWITDAAGALAAAEMAPFVNYAGEDFGQPLGRRPITYTIFGTWNDASVGGVTFDQMYTRAKACYEALHAIDPYCTFIHVSPEPFDDGLFGNAIGMPRRGDKSDTHVRAQMKAAAEVPNVYYVNAFGPEDPWWTGMGPAKDGTQGIPATSQQAQMVSPIDGIHYRREGGRYLANKICDAIADIPVLRARVNGLV